MLPWYELRDPSHVITPSVLIYPDRIAANLQRMIQLAGGVERLRPHVKTHKIPQVVQMKLQAGIDKFKTSTIAEAEMTASAGGTDILLAYPCVGPNIERWLKLIAAYPQVRWSTLVDHPRTVQAIGQAATDHRTRVALLVDLDVGMHRTGIAPNERALQLYQEIAEHPFLIPAGFHAYDGHLHQSDPHELLEAMHAAFVPVWELIGKCKAVGLPVPKLVAGGSPTSGMLADQSLEHDIPIEVGAGTTVLWDFGQSITSPSLDFLNAAVVATRVISQPTHNRLCLDLGHKAIASEMPHPRVRIFGLESAKSLLHNEEHLVLETEHADRHPAGTLLYGLPKHICPTMALHENAFVIRDHAWTDTWKITARVRQIQW
jgi:D-serine deaminase-like pyridoxal phosphate-dependent protein